MTRRLACWMLAGGLLLQSGAAGAITLLLQPSSLGVGTGETFQLGLSIEGLGSGVAPSLGGFDIDIQLDESLFSLTSVAFGASLGAPDFSLTTSGIAGGVLAVRELSLVPVASLHQLQPDAFVLATLTFQAVGSGLGSFAFLQTDLATASGASLPLDAALGASVMAGAPGAAVPEPGAFSAFLAGLTVVALYLRRFRWPHNSTGNSRASS